MAEQSSRALHDVLVGHDLAGPLFEASSTGDVATLRRILEDSPDIVLQRPHRIYSERRPAEDSDDVRGVTTMRRLNAEMAVLWAAENGHVEAVSMLLDFTSRHGLRPWNVITRYTVKAAVHNHHAAVFSVLASADRESATQVDISPHPHLRSLDWAIKLNDTEMVRIILHHGGGKPWPRQGRYLAGWSGHGNPYAGSPLCMAAGKNNIPMVELLMQDGYPIKGSGAMHWAAQFGHVEMIRFLVEKHWTDVNEILPSKHLPLLKNKLHSSWTPLHFAGSRNQEEVMDLLEKYGAKTDALDVNGATAMQLAQEWKEDRELQLAQHRTKQAVA